MFIAQTNTVLCKCVKYSVAVLMLFQCNIQYTVYLLKKKKMVITDTLYFVDAKCFMLSMIQMLFVNCLQI